MRIINGYTIETVGGFITIKYWAVSKDGNHLGIYFRFKQAKEACLANDFTKAYMGRLYD